MKTSGKVKLSCQLVDEMFTSLGMSSQPVLSELVASNFSDFEKKYGTRMACLMQKSVYSDFIRYVLEIKIEPSSPIWMKRDKENIPRLYYPLKRALDKGLNERYVLSLLRTYESVQINPVPDVSSITEDSKGGQNWIKVHKESFESFLVNSRYGNFLKKIFEQSLSDVKSQNMKGYGLHFTTKMGTIGPAMLCAGKESECLSDTLVGILDSFSQNFGKVFKPLYDFGFQDNRIQNFVDVINLNKEFYKSEKVPPMTKDPKTYPFTGKVACIPDKGGKSRVIAIGNYWVQESLLDLHKVIYKVLRKIPQDGTYKQESAADAVRSVNANHDVWSYDLTASTDRFPLEPQVQVLKFLSRQIGDGWENILNNLKFEFRGKPIEYKVGQPMGLYGSWAVFSLTHHSIVQYSAYLERKKYPFKDYRILGDDVAIWDQRVAVRYSEIMQNCLEVKISKQKSITPDLKKPQSNSFSAEFAKKVI